MKVRILLALTFANAFLTLSAQEGKFGFIDFNATLRRMPDYIEAEANLRNIQSVYQDELDRSKREFERQYIEFSTMKSAKNDALLIPSELILTH